MEHLGCPISICSKTKFHEAVAQIRLKCASIVILTANWSKNSNEKFKSMQKRKKLHLTSSIQWFIVDEQGEKISKSSNRWNLSMFTLKIICQTVWKGAWNTITCNLWCLAWLNDEERVKKHRRWKRVTSWVLSRLRNFYFIALYYNLIWIRQVN